NSSGEELLAFHSRHPIAGLSVAMRHGENPDQIVLSDIDNIEGKDFQIHPPVISPHPCQCWLLPNPFQGANHFPVKALAQARLLIIVTFNLRGNSASASGWSSTLTSGSALRSFV